MPNKQLIEHFKAKGRAIAASQRLEPLPRTHEETIRQMLAIDSRCLQGSDDPNGGDLTSHLAHIRFMQAWKSMRHGK